MVTITNQNLKWFWKKAKNSTLQSVGVLVNKLGQETVQKVLNKENKLNM